MVTLKDLKVYRKYNGDEDMFLRAGNKKEKGSSSWRAIDSLIQDLRIIEHGLASADFIENVNQRLLSLCENEAVVEELKRIARQTA